MTLSHRATLCFACGALFALSLALNVWNNDFPLGYHADEGKKVAFVQKGTQDFNHPVLMLQVVRAANTLAGAVDPQRLAVVARTTTAWFGALLVLAACLLARRSLQPPYLWLYGFAVATSPILVVHAHYLKEDILFTCCALGTLGALSRLVRTPLRRNALLLGLALGLALSSQYKGALLLPLLPLAPFLLRGEEKRRSLRLLPLSLFVALGVFALVNYPLFQDQSVFRRGFLFEIQHALHGHDVVIRPRDFWFGFHLTHSIVPGIGLLLTLPALGAMGHTLWAWRRAAGEERLLLVYVLLFYSASEASPLKPFPDAMRYVIPIVPALLFFAVRGLRGTLVWATRGRRGIPAALAAAVLLVPGYDAVQLVRHLRTDTRQEAARWIADSRASALFESYAAAEPAVKYGPDGLRTAVPKYLVTSSFTYDRFFLGHAVGGQSPWAEEKYRQYRELFALPFHEITPAYKSFAFSNPTLRIVDVSSLRPKTRPGPGRHPPPADTREIR